jgi:hypothetical protein
MNGGFSSFDDLMTQGTTVATVAPVKLSFESIGPCLIITSNHSIDVKYQASTLFPRHSDGAGRSGGMGNHSARIGLTVISYYDIVISIFRIVL